MSKYPEFEKIYKNASTRKKLRKPIEIKIFLTERFKCDSKTIKSLSFEP